MKTPTAAVAAVVPEACNSNSRLTGDSDAAADFAMDLPASITLQSTVGGHSRLEGGHSRLERFDSLARGESSDGVRHTRWACLSSAICNNNYNHNSTHSSIHNSNNNNNNNNNINDSCTTSVSYQRCTCPESQCPGGVWLLHSSIAALLYCSACVSVTERAFGSHASRHFGVTCVLDFSAFAEIQSAVLSNAASCAQGSAHHVGSPAGHTHPQHDKHIPKSTSPA